MENNSDHINSLATEINDIVAEFQSISNFLGSKECVSHLSKPILQWRGGILGAVHEYKEDKRLMKTLNTPLYLDKSYYQLAFYIISQTEDMVKKQKEIQSLSSKEEELYHKGVKIILASVLTLIKAWYEYAPDVAVASITIGDQKDVALLPTVESWTKQSIRELDLPEGLNLSEKESSKDNGGCLGIIAFLIISTSCLIALI